MQLGGFSETILCMIYQSKISKFAPSQTPERNALPLAENDQLIVQEYLSTFFTQNIFYKKVGDHGKHN